MRGAIPAIPPAVLIALSLCAGPATGTGAEILPLVRGPAGEPAPTSLTLGPGQAPDGTAYGCNSRWFTRRGRPWLPVMGELHFSRIPRERWSDSLDQMRDAGIDIVSTYVFWNHHEEERGAWDWRDGRDLTAFLDLCRSKGLLVWLRIGPWCHGECRNGGFPDWLMTSGQPFRANSPFYLEAVENLYRQIAAQAQGRYVADGGPVVGLQIENEYGWDTEPHAAHMRTLRALAESSGFRVPFISHFSPKYPADQQDFLSAKGGYADAPWLPGHQRTVRDGWYRFSAVTFDPLVGADLFGLREEVAPVGAPRHPVMMAEFGGGWQVTWRRRPRVFPGDIPAAAVVKLGSGANLLGYYMFHGGSNNLGRTTTLQEGFDFPVHWKGGNLGRNPQPSTYGGLPIINYDFQAPLRQFGQASGQLAELRMLNLALRNFGDVLATTTARMPAEGALGPEALRYAVRDGGDGGFVFFTNHARYATLPTRTGIRFGLPGTGPDRAWPPTPMDIPGGSYGFMPYGLAMDGVRLAWATAQPLCLLDHGPKGRTWVFAALPGIAPEFALDPATVRTRTDDGPLTTVTTNGGATVRILMLSRDQALRAHQVTLAGGQHLVLTNGQVHPQEDGLRVDLYQGSRLEWQVYPPVALTMPGSVTADAGPFAGGAVEFPATGIRVAAEPSLKAPPMDPKVAAQTEPGILYGPDLRPVGGSATWRLRMFGEVPPHIRDHLVEVEFTGDTAALYADGRIIQDEFQYGEPLRFTLGHQAARDLQLQVIPFTPARKLYLEDPGLQERGLVPGIVRITVQPIYTAVLRP